MILKLLLTKNVLKHTTNIIASGGIVFSTIQKFAPEEGSTEYEMLSDRKNIIVIADEAHRSQYGFGAKTKPLLPPTSKSS